MANVLVVTDSPALQADLDAELRDRGYRVLRCRGPLAPYYVCPAGFGGRCVLAEGADAVVIDCDLPSDDAGQGTTSWELVHYYRSLHLPVVALIGPHDVAALLPTDQVTVLPRRSDPAQIADAVAWMLRVKARV